MVCTMSPRFFPCLWVYCILAAAVAWPVHAAAAPVLAIERGSFDREQKGLDLRPSLQYAIVPAASVDPETAWQLPDTAFRPMQAGQKLDIPQGTMMLARIELKVMQVRDPDYLQFPSTRLDRVQLWARAVGQPWQKGEAGDRVALAGWPFAGPFPAFELPDGNERVQLLMAVQHRGSLNLPVEWMPDHAFRADRLAHGFTFGAIAGLAAALALICGLTAWLFRRMEFAVLGGYTLLTALSLMASNGYAAIYLWPQLPAWNDPSKVFLSMVLVSVLLPMVARVLKLDVHRPVWWTASQRWSIAGLAYAVLQLAVLPPEWRTIANMAYVVATLAFAFMLAFYGVLRADAMSLLTFAAVVVITLATVIGYADLFVVNELGLHVANALSRLVFVVLMLCVAVQRHRFGRDVLSRYMAGKNRDPLTGLPNRAGLQQDLQRATLLSDAASTRETGVIICDLRSIGTLRAEYGDEVCDRVLASFAQVLQASSPGGDVLVGRLGFGRFAALVLADTSREHLQAIATRILSRALARTDLPDAVRDMKLRIVMTRAPLSDVRLDAIEAEISRRADEAGESRTIRWL